MILIDIALIALAQFPPAAIGASALCFAGCLQIAVAIKVDHATGKLLLLASSVSFVAAALLGAAAFFRQDIEQTATRPLLLRGGPLGWTLNPGVTRVTRRVDGQLIYSQDVTVEADGHRRTIGAQSGPVVAFFGDSFTLGDGLPDADTLPQAFADVTRRNFRVMNFGVDGYSPAQVLREIELGLYDKALKPAKALFMLTLDWHAARIACAHDSLVGAPHYVSEDGKVHLAGACARPVPTWLERLLAPTPLGKIFAGGLRHVSDGEIETYVDVIVAADRLARSKYGVPLRVLYLRNAGYLIFNRFNDDTLMAALRRRGVNVYDLTLPREGQGDFVIRRDGHPSALAQRLHAQMLTDMLDRTEPDLLKTSRLASH